MRRSVVVVCCAALVAGVLPARAQPPASGDGLRAYSIIPPGQSGTVTVGDILGGRFGPHLSDQLDMYAALVDDDEVTEDELSTYFHAAQLEPDEVTAAYSPRPDVAVERDSFGIPYVTGDDDEALAFGLGYVTAEDRLWQMDVLRHAARGRLSEILGSDQLDFDRDMRRDGYSDGELAEMLDDLATRGPSGAAVAPMIDAYAAGVNAWMDEVRADPAVRPAEYAALAVAIKDWDPLDTVALAIFQLQRFGEAAGAELRNAALLQRLRARHGRRLGTRIFRDLMFANHPHAYTTIAPGDGAFPSQQLPAPDPRAVAMPTQSARLFRAVLGSAERERAVLEELGIRARARSSNALAVAPTHSATGNTLHIGGPQVGYFAPALLMEVVGRSPALAFRGAALPGASVLAAVGRGRAHAWSLTSGASDAVDTRVARLCEPGGGTPSRSSDHYLFEGECRAMESRTEIIRVKSGSTMTEQEAVVQRTRHGPVIARGTVGAAPVAIVQQRHFFGRELHTVPSFYDMARYDMDIDTFKQAAAGFTMSFNVVYVDENDIAYVHAGGFPVRAAGVDPLLPSWGTGEWEWQGTVPFEQLPQVVNASQGWVANWNNKPSTGWDNGDATAWGPTHRVQLLADRMEELFHDGGDATLSDVVNVMRDAATRDARAVYVGPRLLNMVRNMTGPPGRARRMMQRWIAQGAHRRDRTRDGNYDASPAIALFDTWFEILVRRIFDDELGGAYDLMRVPVSADPRDRNGSSFHADFSMYLWDLVRKPRRDRLARDYCDDLRTRRAETCARQARVALRQAVRTLTRRSGTGLPRLTWPASRLRFSASGAATVDPIPWQNRGTYNHVVEVVGP